MCTATEAAYIAGFFDGEGCISLTNRGAVKVTISQKIVDPLDFIQETLGAGSIYYANKRESYRYYLGGRPLVISFLEQTLPYLIVKREKAEAYLEYLKGKYRG